MRTLTLMCGATLCAACAPGELPNATIGNLGVPGLEQNISVSTVSPHVGDSIRVRSVVVNRGTAPTVVSFHVPTSLGFTGVPLAVRPDTLPSAELIFDGPIAPGDSLVVVSYTPPVAASPGDYVLQVRQVTTPGSGVGLLIHVIAAPRTSP